MDAPLSSDHVFDFFVAKPVLRLAEAPDNMNGWIEWDVPLEGEMDEPMVDPKFDEEEMDDDDDDVWDKDEEWVMALVTPLRATVTVSSTYKMSNLKYRHEVLTWKMEAMSDAEVANSIAIREIYPRVAVVKGQIQQMTLQVVHVVSKLEIETRVQQVESRVGIHPGGQTAVPREDVIVGLRQQVKTLQTALHGAELQNQQLRTRVAEIESREGTLMSYMLWMEERLTVLEKRLLGPSPGP
nr:hypothetical protein [Tanacetum cinerariifolium]